MNLDLLSNRNPCACGKNHALPKTKIITGQGALYRLGKILTEFSLKKIFLLADKNTYPLAGAAIGGILSQSGISLSEYIFPEDAPEPDERALGSAVMHFDASCDGIVVLGSGVLNDVGKILSHTASVPYVIVATAPSMDGYASATSSMVRDGVKVSLPSKCPEAIVGDTDLLKTAPDRMLQAGLGDMLAKYVSLCEWKIAHEITGEYYCEAIARLCQEALERCLRYADGLLARENRAIEAVFEGLVLAGLAMQLANCSRPASGVEHYFSHVWDMRALELGSKAELHGIQCAYGTLLTVRLYEKIKKITPDREKALSFVRNFSVDRWNRELGDFLGKSAEAMIALEKKEGKYDPEKHEKRLPVILEKWDTILSLLETLPSAEKLEEIFQKIGLPLKNEGLENESFVLPMTLRASKDIRDKYVLSRLAWDLGVLEELAEEMRRECDQ